jgi:hypothetical protein
LNQKACPPYLEGFEREEAILMWPLWHVVHPLPEQPIDDIRQFISHEQFKNADASSRTQRGVPCFKALDVVLYVPKWF